MKDRGKRRDVKCVGRGMKKVAVTVVQMSGETMSGKGRMMDSET